MNRKKLLLLGDINSVHLQKWISALCDEFDIAVFSLDPLTNSTFIDEQNLKIKICTNNHPSTNTRFKISYLMSFFKLRQFARSFEPDIVHAHYATSYGLLGSLLKHRLFFVSVWGTDVYQFPQNSFIHRKILDHVFECAKKIFSTSESMKNEIQQYIAKEVSVIPFGIDLNRFKKMDTSISNSEFCVGTVKSLEPVYRIDLLIRGFALFRNKFKTGKCFIYGKGFLEKELKDLIEILGMSEHILLQGWIDNAKVPDVLNSFDVFCAFSERESFGVSVIEASSCELPVIVSNAEGFMEVVEHNKTGIILEEANADSVAKALEYIHDDPDNAILLGQKGREFVKSNYNWQENVKIQVNHYKSELKIL